MKKLLLVLAACGGKAAPKVHVIDNGGGTSTCEAVVDQTRAAGAIYPDWLALWSALSADAPSDETTNGPVSPQWAHDTLCRDEACDGPGPWIVMAGDFGNVVTFALVAPRPDGSLLAFAQLGDGMGGRCEWHDDVALAPVGKPVEVIVTRGEQDMNEVHYEGDEVVDGCFPDKNQECGEECNLATDEIDYLYFDLAARVRVLAVTAHDGITVIHDQGAVHIEGKGCDQAVPL